MLEIKLKAVLDNGKELVDGDYWTPDYSITNHGNYSESCYQITITIDGIKYCNKIRTKDYVRHTRSDGTLEDFYSSWEHDEIYASCKILASINEGSWEEINRI